MAADNKTILGDVWLKGTNDFQQRIPNPTQGSIQSTIDALLDPMNQNYYNQFIDALVMRIGDQYVHQQQFQNPLKAFKKSRLQYGSTMQEIVPKWIRAHAYVDDAEDVFKMSRPDVATWYHSQNRRDRYDITINDEELRTAFTEEYGLNRLVSSILQVPINSDEYDEYRIMLQLIAFYDNAWGFYKHQLSAVPSDESTGKEFLRAVRSDAMLLGFPSTVYNSNAIPDVPIFAKPEELVLITTPATQASVDVDTLSSVFQLDKAELKYRIVIVDEFPVSDPDCVAILTTEDFFMCRDTEYRTTSMYNPKTLGTNYYLHHWGIYSVSPFVPAIMYTTGAGTVVSTVTENVTGISATVERDTAKAGDEVPITVQLVGVLQPNDPRFTVAPNAATYDVSVTDTAGLSVNSPATRVDEYGILHLSKRLEKSDKVDVIVTSAYTNPSGKTTEYTATVSVTIE